MLEVALKVFKALLWELNTDKQEVHGIKTCVPIGNQDSFLHSSNDFKLEGTHN